MEGSGTRYCPWHTSSLQGCGGISPKCLRHCFGFVLATAFSSHMANLMSACLLVVYFCALMLLCAMFLCCGIQLTASSSTASGSFVMIKVMHECIKSCCTLHHT